MKKLPNASGLTLTLTLKLTLSLKLMLTLTLTLTAAFVLQFSMPSHAAPGEATVPALPLLPETPQDGFGKALPEARNDVVMASSYIAMPDGTRLAADIYRPAKNGVAIAGRFPIILHHTASRGRYTDDSDRSGAGRFSLQMINLASYGYVYIQVERRGMAASFGVRRGYHDRTEAQDAFDLTEWAARQPWSDGKIGFYGCSNTGDAAMHALTRASSHLKAVFAGCFNWDKYSGGMRGGILANWGTGPQGSFDLDMRSTPVDGDDDKTLLRQAVLQHEANTHLLDLWSGMPYRDSVSPLTHSAFWEEGSIGTYLNQIRASRVPVYIQGGWLDDFRAQGPITYANLAQPKKWIIGPWGHCVSDDFNMVAEALRFFDYWLKGVKNGVMQEAPIHYYTMNAPFGTAWRSSKVWPLKSAQPRKLFLSSANGATANDHPLSWTMPKIASGTTSFVVDYKPVCAKGIGLGPTCPQDDKGLTFTSAVLKKDTEVTGHPLAELWVSSTATDGPVFAYLEDVDADGTITMVSEGRLKASLRTLNKAPYDVLGLPWHGFYQADAKLLTPGVPVQLIFDMLPVSYVFKAGHHYRLTITGADPREKLRTELPQPPTWTIYADQQHPSHIVLPINAPHHHQPLKTSTFNRRRS